MVELKWNDLYALFGTKYAKIFYGPMWSYIPIMQTENVMHPTLASNPMAPVNVTIAILDWYVPPNHTMLLYL